jgi:hypothetical protein
MRGAKGLLSYTRASSEISLSVAYVASANLIFTSTSQVPTITIRTGCAKRFTFSCFI